MRNSFGGGEVKIGFYCSGKATRVTKLLETIREAEVFRDFLQKVGFIYVDHSSPLPLDSLCETLEVRLIKEKPQALSSCERRRLVSQRLLTFLKDFSCDYLFVLGKEVLVGELIKEYMCRIINFHPSLLPAFPGIGAIDKALEYGCFIFGNTAHFIDEGIDTGPIIMQNICICEEFSGYDEILDHQIPMILQITLWIEAERLQIDGRRVRVKRASYALSEYIPNLEFDWKFKRSAYETKQ